MHVLYPKAFKNTAHVHAWMYTLRQKFSGQSGCKNEADGGENVANEEGPYFVYFVYKSFQRPSNACLLNTAGEMRK